MIHWLEGHAANRIGQYGLCMAMDHALDVGIPLVDFTVDIPFDEPSRCIFVVIRSAVLDTILDEIRGRAYQCWGHVRRHEVCVRLVRMTHRDMAIRIDYTVVMDDMVRGDEIS